MAAQPAMDAAISRFGEAVTRKSAPSTGESEEQLRGPFETLLTDISDAAGMVPGSVTLVGETLQADLLSRPDFAVYVRGALVGFVELKAPGKGADPRRFKAHDKRQWERLSALPNLLYTDGNTFSLWRDGEREGEIVRLDGDVESSGAGLSAPPGLLSLFANFLQWTPTPPWTAKQLADLSARLSRLLRDEVTEQIKAKNPALTNLAKDWRRLLFPEATDEAFADGYAQAVTFGLLLARARGIDLEKDLSAAARELQRTNSLIGTALRLLIDAPAGSEPATTSLGTLRRVLGAVDWNLVAKGDPDAWLYFYEEFLSVYDNALRKRTGSYYTPPEVVQAMVRLTDEALHSRERFDVSAGLASRDVTVADPAAGTGTFLLGILRRIADRTEAEYGAGAVPAVIAEALPRLIGFELQFGPYAVAQLRLIAEVAALTGSPRAEGLRLFVTDTLGNPYAEEEWIPAILMPLAESRREANAVKRSEPITVVIGNPPYKEKAKGRGGWIEEGSANRLAPLADWRPPPEWKVGAHAKHLRNLYVYFWRWATWKVFGGIEDEETRRDRKGIVNFITVAGFLNGPGFQKMRADLRRDADEIFVVDCSPEGHQPEVATRIFQGVQQPVCIVIAIRRSDEGTETPARVRYRSLPEGHRTEKFAALGDVTLDGSDWQDCPEDWRASFLPQDAGAWGSFVGLEALFSESSSGVLPGRTWVIAPDRQSLVERWRRLRDETDPGRKETLFHPTLRGGKPADRHSRKVVLEGLPGHDRRTVSVADDQGEAVEPTRYAYRSFDRQWILPDNRLLLSARSKLWGTLSSQQVFLTALTRTSPTNGPSTSFAALIPDMDHYNGRGGRVFPLWRDAGATEPNIKPALLAHLSTLYRRAVGAEDVMAYIAALLAHPGYTARFREELRQPGLRVPLTARPDLFMEAAALGREVIWLHTYGERFVDPEAGRPHGPPRLPAEAAPTIPQDGAIPSTAEDRPDGDLSHDPATSRLYVGEGPRVGFVANVPKTVFDYEVSGKNVLRQWFSYRRKDRSRPLIGDKRPPSPLDKVQPDHWLPEYTEDLLNLLHVLGRLVRLEPAQDDLLARVLASPLISEQALQEAGALASGSGAPTSSDPRQPNLI